MLARTLTLLSQEHMLKSAGFMAGLTCAIFGDREMCVKLNYDHASTQQNGTKKTTDIKIDTSQFSIIENPLSTLLAGSFNGVIYSVCASFVGGCLPYNLRPCVPICLGLSMINNMYKYIKYN